MIRRPRPSGAPCASVRADAVIQVQRVVLGGGPAVFTAQLDVPCVSRQYHSADGNFDGNLGESGNNTFLISII